MTTSPARNDLVRVAAESGETGPGAPPPPDPGPSCPRGSRATAPSQTPPNQYSRPRTRLTGDPWGIPILDRHARDLNEEGASSIAIRGCLRRELKSYGWDPSVVGPDLSIAGYEPRTIVAFIFGDESPKGFFSKGILLQQGSRPTPELRNAMGVTAPNIQFLCETYAAWIDEQGRLFWTFAPFIDN